MDIRPLLGTALVVGAALMAGAGASGCDDGGPPPKPLQGQVHLTLLHTSDIHSRLFPYNVQLGQIDAGLGLGAVDTIANVGGAARMSHIIGRERARSSRVLHLDGGDCFQGAPVFNFFNGEAEVRTVSAMGADAMIVANHEFDKGALNLGIQLQQWASMPILAANYRFEDSAQPGASPLGSIIKPFDVFHLQGLKVGVVGMGNLSSLTSVFDQPNRLGILPLVTTETAQFYVDLLRPMVDVIVFVTHLGLEVDERMIEGTTGIDVVLGGHNHLVLQPPKRVQDCAQNTDEEGRHFLIMNGPEDTEPGNVCGADSDCETNFCFGSAAELAVEAGRCKAKRYCEPRNVVLAHSGAFAKYVGRLDLILSNDEKDFPKGAYDKLNGFEVMSQDYQLFPVNETVPQDPVIARLLEPYAQGLDNLANLDLLVGYALDGSKRNATGGGDSPLGNMISTAMWLRLGVQTDFALTNTTGIRADLVPGPVTVEQMFNIFPFDNSITKMQLSGVEVQELFDFNARRSAGRACTSQAQIAGARVVLDCKEFGKVDGPEINFFLPCSKDEDCPVPTVGVCDTEFGFCRTEIEAAPGVATDIYVGVKTCEQAPECGGRGSCDGSFCRCTSDEQCPGAACEKDGECGVHGRCVELPDSKKKECVMFGSCDADNGLCWQRIDPLSSYELATSNYLAQGGSGFRVLQRNTTQLDTKVQQRDALIDYIRAGFPCGANDDGKLTSCKVDGECAALGDGFVCACPEAVEEDSLCSANGAECSAGACVLAKCRQEVASFQRETCEAAANDAIREQCEDALNPCAAGGEQCKFLACIDRRLGNFSDGRLNMVGK